MKATLMRMRPVSHMITPMAIRMIMVIITITITTSVTTRTTTAIITTTTSTITTTSIAATIITTGIPMLMKTSNPDAQQGSETPRPAGMSDSEAASLYRLMTWLSPSFPVGAFSYSSGLEWAVEAGDIGDAASLRPWLASMLADGAGLCDGIFLAHAHRAASSGDGAGLARIAELASAFVPSRERHLETTAQGRAFIEIARAAWSSERLGRLIAPCETTIVYPVAVGLVSAAHDIPLAPTVHAFLHAVASNWISAAARLVPLGQTDSQRVLAELEEVVSVTAKRSMAASLDDLGSTTFRADIASMRHETQYTRLFRS